MIRLLSGDCRDVLATLPADSVQCVVTSPPYYGLRDYGTAQWDGGNTACDHVAGNARNDVTPERLAERAAQFGTGTGAGSKVGAIQFRDTCGKCGAVRVDRQIGLEPTPDEYLATMVAVFTEVRRVLRPDGTCWVNMGDSYASAPVGSFNGGGFKDKSAQTGGRDMSGVATSGIIDKVKASGLKPKDLLMMPARLALALQADGWWIRSDIIWHKPNPMPESVTDRCVSAHEHVFMLTKSARYFFDSVAIAEPTEASSLERLSQDVAGQVGSVRANGGAKTNGPMRAVGGPTRSCRNVWTLATHSFAAAHFATYPPALAERCIKAGTSERGCCSQCGKPWVRVTDTSYQKLTGSSGRNDSTGSNNWDGGGYPRMDKHIITTGWRAGCDHEAPVVPCTVLDPFAGAGTTLLVADRLQRDAIGIELNTAYTEMAMQRCRDDAPLFADLPPAADPEDERMADLFAEAAE